MEHVTSNDGTAIGYDRLGEGPPVVLVCGGSVDRMSNAPVAELLATDHTAFNYDRRGRGDSGDTQPYAVDREIDDIAAVVDAAGGSAFLYGTSSGAVLALKAAAKLDSITKLALWEPPYIPEGVPRPPADTAETYRRLVAEDRRGDAVEFFMTKVVGMPDEFVAQAKHAPFWGPTEALAHTLAYDATVMGDYTMPADIVESVPIPTLVLAGSASFPWMDQTARAMADLLPKGQHGLLEGQTHDVDPSVITPALEAFFAA
jgi:pimeloyl-ACP methyl ester carboxylesterase